MSSYLSFGLCFIFLNSFFFGIQVPLGWIVVSSLAFGFSSVGFWVGLGEFQFPLCWV
jgi:hypothetical protein